MSRRYHDWNIPKILKAYATERGVDYERFGDYHMRMSYGEVATVDVWTTHKYWVKETNYLHGLIERGGETGHFPEGKKAIYNFLDKLLFAIEIKETEGVQS